MRYLDFDLRLWETEEGLCRITAEAGDLGEASAQVRIDAGEPGLAELLRRLAERRSDEAALRTLGQTLFGLLFADDVETLFQRAFGVVEGRAEMGLRLRLRLRIASPRLATLPWELLHSRLDDVFLATRLMTPVVRYVDLPHVRRELATALPLRILVAIPGDTPHLPPMAVDKEKRIIDDALRGLQRQVEATYLHELYEDRRVTWTRIHERLAEGEYHVFHFIGHGGFHDGHGHLALDGDDGGTEVVADEQFAGLFADHRAMKLVVLNACESATPSSGHRLDGCAARLVKAGVPAVVAMQYAVRDAAALDFARSFYHSLFRSAGSTTIWWSC